VTERVTPQKGKSRRQSRHPEGFGWSILPYDGVKDGKGGGEGEGKGGGAGKKE